MNFVGTLKPRERQGGIQAIMLAQVQEPISGPGYLNIFFIMPIRALPAARLYAHTAQALATGRYPLQSLTRAARTSWRAIAWPSLLYRAAMHCHLSEPEFTELKN